MQLFLATCCSVLCFCSGDQKHRNVLWAVASNIYKTNNHSLGCWMAQEALHVCQCAGHRGLRWKPQVRFARWVVRCDCHPVLRWIFKWLIAVTVIIKVVHLWSIGIKNISKMPLTKWDFWIVLRPSKASTAISKFTFAVWLCIVFSIGRCRLLVWKVIIQHRNRSWWD